MRLALLTATGLVDESVLSELRRLGYAVTVVKTESLSPEAVARALEGVSYDYAIAPGLSPFDYSLLRNVVKGTLSLKLLPKVLREAGLRELSPSLNAEKVLGEQALLRVYSSVLEEASRKPVWLAAGGVRLPLRPPPVAVFSDIYVKRGDPVEKLVNEASYRLSTGADAVVLSFDPAVDRDTVVEIVGRVVEEKGAPVAVDYYELDALIHAVDAGASIALSVTREKLQEIPQRLRDSAFYVVIPGALGDWRLRARELSVACEKARELGLRVILDPVMQPLVSPGALEGLLAARELGRLCEHYPMMLGLNNAVELADVDTHASIATLALLAVEAGVSVVMVGEESYKARASTLEAKTAAVMATLAVELETLPKDLPVKMLRFKEKNPPPGVKYLGGGVYETGAGIVDCRVESSSELCKPWRLEGALGELVERYSSLFSLRAPRRETS